MARTSTARIVVFGLLLVVPCRALAGQDENGSPHGELARALDCSVCHTVNGWSPPRDSMGFSHGETRFPLVGVHQEVSCGSCHLGLVFAEPKINPNDCSSCHLDVHRGNLSQNCESCHTATSFADVEGFATHLKTSFPLFGAHAQVTCESCHVDDRAGAFTPLDAECISCHQADYQTVAIVDHAAVGFAETCSNCHNTLTWVGGVAIDHVTLGNGYPLLGAHDGTPCRNCHIGPNGSLRFTPAGPDDCIACHQTEYQQEHPGYPMSCTDCHTQDTWAGADFDHARVGSGYELLGAHEPLPCSSCHILPGTELLFNPIDQNDCVACHATDYANAHAGSMFPTTCATCHSVDNWDAQSASHDSDYFPIYSGAHRNRWASCATCHTVQSDFAQFTCLTCHEHDRTKMDDKHHEKSGYIYESTQCLSCHPRGN